MPQQAQSAYPHDGSDIVLSSLARDCGIGDELIPPERENPPLTLYVESLKFGPHRLSRVHVSAPYSRTISTKMEYITRNQRGWRTVECIPIKMWAITYKTWVIMFKFYTTGHENTPKCNISTERDLKFSKNGNSRPHGKGTPFPHPPDEELSRLVP